MRGSNNKANSVALGASAGYTGEGASCVFLGYQAGYYDTADNSLYIDNVSRASLADGKAKALIYGIFAAAPANQYLYFNANVSLGVATVAPDSTLHVLGASAGTVTSATDLMTLEDDTSNGLSILLPNTATASILFGDPDDNDVGGITYDHATNLMAFRANATDWATMSSAGKASFRTAYASDCTVSINGGTIPTIYANTREQGFNIGCDDTVGLTLQGNVLINSLGMIAVRSTIAGYSQHLFKIVDDGTVSANSVGFAASDAAESGDFQIDFIRRAYPSGTDTVKFSLLMEGAACDFALKTGASYGLFYDISANNIAVGGNAPTARLHLPAGSATASTAPLKFTSGTLLGTAEAGAVEFTTDDLFFTISTGAARKGFVLNDGTNLTSGRIPFGTTNGRLTDDASITFVDPNLVLDKASTGGIKVDNASPTFGWFDILGEVKILSPGANDPTLSVFRDSVKQFSFSNAVMNEIFITYHIPHDYVIGSDLHIHTHWGQNVVDSGGTAGAPGDCKWSFEVTYAKGHNQAAFPASFTTSVTQTASGTQYQHMLAEVQLSAASPSATQIDSDDIEPDGVIIVRAFRDPGDVADTLNQVPFLHYVDIHYQSTNIATKDKVPDFYS